MKTYCLTTLGIQIDKKNTHAIKEAINNFAILKIKIEISENEYTLDDLFTGNKDSEFTKYLNKNFLYTENFSSLDSFYALDDSFVIKNKDNIISLLTEKGFLNEFGEDEFFEKNRKKIIYYFLVKGVCTKYRYHKNRATEEEKETEETVDKFRRRKVIYKSWFYSSNSGHFRNTKDTRMIDSYEGILNKLININDIDECIESLLLELANGRTIISESENSMRKVLKLEFLSIYKINP